MLDCEIGDDCTIHAPVWIGNGVKIGNRVKIQAFSFIPEGVEIADDVFIGPRVTFTNDKYPPQERRKWTRTIVKKNAMIGAGAIILPGIIIGIRAKVGAGSVVTKSVRRDEVVCGNPAHLMEKYLRVHKPEEDVIPDIADRLAA